MTTVCMCGAYVFKDGKHTGHNVTFCMYNIAVPSEL